jgi:hypothetical protein
MQLRKDINVFFVQKNAICVGWQGCSNATLVCCFSNCLAFPGSIPMPILYYFYGSVMLLLLPELVISKRLHLERHRERWSKQASPPPLLPSHL